MYIKSKLVRKCTENIEILSKEHICDVELYKENIKQGNHYERDYSRIFEIMEELHKNKELSKNEKKHIMDSLLSVLEKIEIEYNDNIQNTLEDIKVSLSDRIDEIEEAKKKRENETCDMERTLWETDFVDKNKLVLTYSEVCKNFSILLEKAAVELSNLTKASTEQRNKIFERRKKTGGDTDEHSLFSSCSNT